MRLPKRNKFDNKKKIIFQHKDYRQPVGSVKPNGFWYSCYNSWYDWVKFEMPMWLRKYIHKINIKPNKIASIQEKDKDKILVIKNIKDFDIFNKRYGFNASFGKKFWKK